MRNILRASRVRVVGAVACAMACTAVGMFAGRATADPATKSPPFTVEAIRFDESVSGTMPTPQIPKTWRFIAVSNGEKPNSNNLWFQDAEGNIYLVQGFTSFGKFIVNGKIQSLAATK